MPGVIADSAQMVCRMQGAEPHRPVQSGNHPPVQIFEQGSGQLAPYCRTHSLLLVHLVYQHYPMLPATVGTLFLTTPMRQALGRLEGKVCAQYFVQGLSEFVLITGSLINEQPQVLAHTAACEHADTFANHQPWNFDPPSF